MTASLTTLANLYKNKFAGYTNDMVDLSFSKVNPLIKPEYFKGDSHLETFDLGFHGGVGVGRLPQSFPQPQVRISVQPTNLYGRVYIDRRSWKQSQGGGAYEDILKNQNTAMAQGFSRMLEFFAIAGTATLGTIDTGGVSGTNPYSLTITAGSWNQWHWEVNMHVQIGTGQTDVFRVTAINRATRVVTVTRITGSKVPAAGEAVIWQGGDLAVPSGMRGIATGAGPFYGVTSQYRFAPRNLDQSAAAISENLVDNWITTYEEETGVSPTHAVCSFKQYRLLKQTQFGRKSYEMATIQAARKGGPNKNAIISLEGIAILTADGPIPVFPSRFCFPDEFFLCHKEKMKQIRVEDFGFLDDDLKMLRVNELDQYEIRYGGYAENIFHPFYIQRHFNLA